MSDAQDASVPKEAVGPGGLIDVSWLECPQPVTESGLHSLRSVRDGTRDKEPVYVDRCQGCGETALNLRAAAGDVHAQRDQRAQRRR